MNHVEKLVKQVQKASSNLPEVGEITQTKKWGQTAFLPKRPRVGTTVRVDQAGENEVALYVHCQTNLVETYRTLFPELKFEGNRAVLFDCSKPLPEKEIALMVEAAMTYHLRKRK